LSRELKANAHLFCYSFAERHVFLKPRKVVRDGLIRHGLTKSAPSPIGPLRIPAQRPKYKVDEQNEQIAHRGIVAGRRILRNHARNNNSPATGCLKKPESTTPRAFSPWAIEICVRTVLPCTRVHRRISFTRLRQGRKLLELRGPVGGMTSPMGCTFSGGTVGKEAAAPSYCSSSSMSTIFMRKPSNGPPE